MQSGSPPRSQPEEYARSSSLLRRVVVLAAFALAGVVVGVIVYGYLDMPGSKLIGVANKNFWDYLDLLIVPAALALGVYLLNWMQSERARKAEIVQDAREREAEENRRERERETEENRREREREAQAAQWERELEVESQRAQDEALQAYLDQISKLLLDKQRPLQQSQEGNEVRTVARARTLTVLPRLDSKRKRSVLQFLYESGLVFKDRTIVDLKGADLSNARLSAAELTTVNLSEAALSGAYLNAADLRGIDMSEAALSRADLSSANLHEANLSGADLLDADLSAANLHEANLSEADLLRAHLSSATLHRANLSGAELREAKLLRANLHEANLSRADLRWTDLREANLHRADLSRADLSEAQLVGADLREATLSGATLSGANLEGVLGIANEELRHQAYPLDGVTMPNGQKYEDWIKTSKDGHGKDGENSGLS
jgi:uncharacterized protein YjbI with pentapeptide repeats